MKRDLWRRLKRYQFDHLVPPQLMDRVAAAFGGADASTKAFANKLARKLRWSPAFALQAIDEYKKFIFLGVVSDFQVTPPKVIDQVWHEHILFSRAYRRFCSEVLEHEFDHHPELFATDEQTSVFQAQYAATLDLYLKEFNYPPPAAIWGTPKFNAASLGPISQKPRAKVADSRSTSSSDVHLWQEVSTSGDDSCHSSFISHGISFGDSAGGGDGGSDAGGSGCSSGCGGGCGS